MHQRVLVVKALRFARLSNKVESAHKRLNDIVFSGRYICWVWLLFKLRQLSLLSTYTLSLYTYMCRCSLDVATSKFNTTFTHLDMF